MSGNYISVLVYGKGGVGKSIFASTFPKPLIFDFDFGHKRYEEQNAFPDAKYVRGDTVTKSGTKLTMLDKFSSALEQITLGTFQYKTIVIDSLTALENAVINQQKGINVDNLGSSLYKMGGGEMDWEKWGVISGSTISLLTLLRTYPINLVVTTQVETYKAGKLERIRPELIGKGKNEALHFPDFVMFMEYINGERLGHLRSAQDDYFVAKARLANKNISYIKNPNYEKLSKLVKETKVDLDFS